MRQWPQCPIAVMPMFGSVIYTIIKIVRLSVTVGDRGKPRAVRGWLCVLGMVDTRFGVSQPATDAER